MAGPFELDQTGIRDALGDEASVLDRDDPVLPTVHHERRRRDPVEPVVAVVQRARPHLRAISLRRERVTEPLLYVFGDPLGVLLPEAFAVVERHGGPRTLLVAHGEPMA